MRSPAFYFLASAVLATSAMAQPPLTTFFATNNAGAMGGAVYFDLTVTTPITIAAIDVNCSGTGGFPGSLDVYTVAGGRAGNMMSQANWTGPAVLGNPLTTAPVDTPSTCTLTSPLVLPSGVYGVALVANGFGHAYTNGNGTNQTHTGPGLQLDAGNADNTPFLGGNFSPRVSNLTIHYSAGTPGTVYASAINYGTGCVASPERNFYELFAPGTFDLVAPVDNMALLHTGFGYLGFTGPGVYVPPTTAAQALQLSDDSEVQVALTNAMPVGVGSSALNLHVCSNGFISTGPNGTNYAPSATAMLNNPNPAWYSWHDYNPSAGGTVWFEEAGGVAYVTWDNVPSFGQTQGETLQFQFDTNTGAVLLVWVSISGNGNSHLVGYSSGGTSADPGSSDLSALLPNAVPAIASFALDPLQLDAVSRPIANAPMQMATSNLTPGTLFGAVIFGLTQLPTPLDLTALGMTGCYQYTDHLAPLLFFPTGAVSQTVPITVPNMVNLNMHAQAFAYDPSSGLTTLGAVASNATHLLIGDW